MITVGKQAIENRIRRYVGVGAYEVVAFNPTKEEIKKLMPWKSEVKDSEVAYITEREGVKTLKLDFYIRLVGVKKGTVLEDVNIDKDGNVSDFPVDKITFFMTEAAAMSQAKGTYQVIDAYGVSAWVEVNDGKVVFDPNKSYGISTDGLRTAFQGEVAVNDFLKALFNVPQRVHVEAGGVWKVDVPDTNKEALDACRCQFEKPSDLFNGKWGEITAPIKDAQGYRIKLLRGYRNVNNNKYTDFYTSRPMRNSTTSYAFLEKSLKRDSDEGRLNDRYFGEFPYDFTEVNEVITPTPMQGLVDMPISMPESPVTESVFDPVFGDSIPPVL